MITNLLTKINKELEELNYQLRDNDYLNDLENKINIINETINMEHQQNIKLKSILKEVRRIVECYERIEGHYTYTDSFGKKVEKFDDTTKEELLEVLDKENK